MRSSIRRLCAAVLCMVLLGFTACQKDSGDSGDAEVRATSNSSGPEAAMASGAKGRYMERELPLPEGFQYVVTMDEVSPDEYYIFGRRSEAVGPWEIWRSGDGGESWEQKRPGWLAELEGAYVTGVAFTGEGDAYVSYGMGMDAETPVYHTAFADGTGLRQLEGNDLLLDYSDGLALTSSGKLLINKYFEMYCLDLETGKDKKLENQSMFWMGTYAVYDNVLAANGGEGIMLFDLETGEIAAELPIAAESKSALYSIAPQTDRSGFLYCDAGGLYRVTMDGSMTEQLIEGALVSLGMPSVGIQKLVQREDGSFVALCARSGDDYALLHYVYDPDVSRTPEHELSIFSLEESRSMRQAVGMFQAENPDVRVDYRAALTKDRSPADDSPMENENAVTASDALRTLSTEILAGKGPDILVLDGMPIESYIEKGILLDLSDALEGRMGELLPGVAGAYAQDAGLFAVPARFGLPILVGEDTGDVGNLPQLVDWLLAKENPQAGISQEELLAHFYDLCSTSWLNTGGTVNKEALSADLSAISRYRKRLDEIQNVKKASFIFMSNFYGGNGIGGFQNNLDRFDDLAYVYAAIDKRGAGELRTFPAQPEGLFIPRSVLGVNSAGQTELAADFVRYALSKAPQEMQFEDGLAVNVEALEAQRSAQVEGTEMGSFSTFSHETQEEYNLTGHWPSDERVDAVFDMMRAAKTPAVCDVVVRQMVMDETAGYFTGELSLEETVDALAQKVDRYMQERE